MEAVLPAVSPSFNMFSVDTGFTFSISRVASRVLHPLPVDHLGLLQGS